MATKKEQELAARVQELELINDNLLFDFEWQKASTQNVLRTFAQLCKKTKGRKRGAHLKKVQGTAKGEGQARVKRERDAFGNAVGTQGHLLNSFIVPLIERGRWTGFGQRFSQQDVRGRIPASRFRDHLGWLRRHNYI